MTSFRARYKPGQPKPDASHVTVQVFAGPDEDHRALAGELVFTPHEAMDFLARFNGEHASATVAYPTPHETAILPPARRGR